MGKTGFVYNDGLQTKIYAVPFIKGRKNSKEVFRISTILKVINTRLWINYPHCVKLTCY